MIQTIVLLLVAQVQQTPVPPSWNQDVAPIIAQRCASCHYDGGVAPFALVSYQDVAKRSTFILKVLDAGIMPPWLPGEGSLEFAQSRELPAGELEILRKWVAAGALVGEGDALTVAVPKKPAMKADLTRVVGGELELPEETPPAYHSGEMDQHAFRLTIANSEPFRVRAIRATSNAPKTSRVMTVLVDDGGGVFALDKEDPVLGWRMGSDVGYVPAGAHGTLLLGGGPMRLPSGFHWEYPPGSEVALGVHYRPTGRVEVLKEKLEFERVPEGEASRPLRWLPAVAIGIDVPAEEVVRVESSELVIPVDVDLVALTPRAIEICVHSRLVAEFPDGTQRILLQIPDWDHHRRETYVLAEPLRLPAGTRIQSEWTLDNRAANPRNPDDPPIDLIRRKRAGILGTLLHVAAVESDEDVNLSRFGASFIREEQRPR